MTMPKKRTSSLQTLIERGFKAVAEDIADLRKDMATKDDVREIVREELKPIETRLAAVEGKVAGIDRRLDTEAIRRDDEKIPTRVEKIEKHIGIGKKIAA
jgi:phage shock protein A